MLRKSSGDGVMKKTKQVRFSFEDSSLHEWKMIKAARIEEEKRHSTCAVMGDHDHKLDEWVLNTVSRFHVCSIRSWFKSFKEELGTVMVDLWQEFQIEGSGIVSIQLCNGFLIDLANVKYVPDAKRCFISLGVLDGEGYEVNIKNGVILVCKEGIECMKGSMCKEMGGYVFHGHTISEEPCKEIEPLEEQKEEKTLDFDDDGVDDFFMEDHQILECWMDLSAWESSEVAKALSQKKDVPEELSYVQVKKHDEEAWKRQQLKLFLKFSFTKLFCASVLYNHLHIKMFERNVLTYLSNILQNHIFDPGGVLISALMS